MKAASLAAAALVVLGAAAAGQGTACQGRLDHQFGGYAYDEADNCLYASGAIDIVAGADPGMCPMLRCWQGPDGSIYVTDEACDAPPDYQDLTHSTSGPCVKALALYAMPGHMLCPMPDGGAGGSGT